MARAQRIAVAGTCSGVGKTTLTRRLATAIGAPAVELDSYLHLPGWREASDEQLRADIAPIVAGERWVIDGLARRKLGPLISDRAQLIVWLDLPPWVWLPRLAQRTLRRWLSQEELWNGNRESFRSAFIGRESLFGYAIVSYWQQRPQLARRMRELDTRPDLQVVRLCSTVEVDAFVADFNAAG